LKVPRVDYEDILDVLFEFIDIEKYVVAHYIVEIPAGFPPDIVARAFVAEQTTGTWIRTSAETTETR